MPRKKTPPIAVIRRLDQIRMLASGVRQEILDALQASGPLTARQLARLLGRAPDSLYYHLKKLVSVDLVRHRKPGPKERNSEARFELPSGPWHIQYDVDDPESVSAMARVVVTLLRVTGRNYRRALAFKGIVPYGPKRNVSSGRTIGWVTEEELAAINAKTQEILEILQKSKPPPDSRLVGFTHAITLLREDGPEDWG